MRKYFVDSRSRILWVQSNNIPERLSTVNYVYGAATLFDDIVAQANEQTFLLQQQCMWDTVVENRSLIDKFFRMHNIPYDEFYDAALHGLCKCAVMFNNKVSSTFKSYVYRMLWNVTRRSPMKKDLLLDDLGDLLSSIGETPREPVTYDMVRERLWTLNEDEIHFLYLRFVHDLSFERIGRRVGLVGQTARYRFLQIMKKVDQCRN